MKHDNPSFKSTYMDPNVLKHDARFSNQVPKFERKKNKKSDENNVLRLFPRCILMDHDINHDSRIQVSTISKVIIMYTLIS